MQNLLIVISGLPCTGKTTLARQIAQKFLLPLISRDDIKETLFDSLGWQDREWSKKLGCASYELLYYFVESQISAGRSLVIESNFKPEFDTNKFLYLINKYNFILFKVHCTTEMKVLFQRFQNRSESGERHPGHVDHLRYEEFKISLRQGGYEILDIGGQFFEVDTTDFKKIDYNLLFEAIKSVANRT